MQKWHKSRLWKLYEGSQYLQRRLGSWSNEASEVLTCVREAGNDDPYSVAMINCSMSVVGHELMAEEGILEDSALCGLETAESRLK